MINLNVEKYAETKIVSLQVRTDNGYQGQPDYLPPAGWVVVALWSEAFDEPWYSNGTTEPLRRTRTCVLLGRTQDVALADAKAKNDELATKVNALSAAEKASEEKRKLASEVLAEVTRDREQLEQRISIMTKQREAWEGRYRQMESDLGKLREVLGRKQIDSILSEKQS